MRRIPMAVFVSLEAVLAFTCWRSAGGEPKRSAAKAHNQLVGTWRTVSAKYGGKDVKRPDGFTAIKYATPSQFMWAWCDKDGKVMAALGGSYTLKGNDYVEMPQYGTEAVLRELQAKPQEFTWKVEGNKWYLSASSVAG